MSVAEAIDSLVSQPRAKELVLAYFDPGSTFAGCLFDEVGDNPPDAITVDDLFAVSLLDISFTGRAVRELLGSSGVTRAIVDLPATTPLWEATDAHLAAADRAWTTLVALPGIGETTASKVLARKRPYLMPIVDSIAVKAFGKADVDYWRDLRLALGNERRRAHLETLRPDEAAGLSTLRVLDILVWMAGSQSRSAEQARTTVGFKD